MDQRTAPDDGDSPAPPRLPRSGGPAPAPGRSSGAWAHGRTALRRTPLSLWNEDVSDWAAALTYYAILALVPALLVTISVIDLVAPATTDELIADVSSWAPAESGTALHQALSGMAGQRSAALTVLIGGTFSALWSASSYLAVFRRALHSMYAVKDERPAWRKAHRILLTAVILLALLVVSALVLVLSGSLAQSLGHALGLGNAGTDAWDLLKWPALLCCVALLVLILFRSGPPAARTIHRGLPGGVLAALLWLTASAGFTAYATGFGTYSRLYGSLAGVVVFLVWLWVSNLALLAGAQFNAELSRAAAETATRPSGGQVVAPRLRP
ncbi:YihY/virulence factor BrkB family protein [Streptomyces sp. A 4/2]|uniref:YihY/virulence factor BrkB family protein n=1 Tax=Streptomyces sp. A 4/2 TaxID=2934314 RepID=UPI00202526B7|nr:YihY/virulence factor BrkB family protein [Streptomyces sp. A 4/2]